MKPADLWRLAWRGLTRRPVRTVLTALGIVVAVASMVIFLSLGEGIRRVFTQQLSNVGPDIQVSLSGLDSGFISGADLPQSTVADLQRLAPEYGITTITPAIISARGGFAPGQQFLLYGLPTTGAGIRAAVPSAEVAQGRLLTPADSGQGVAVVGVKAAQNANLKLGSTLRLTPRASVRVVGVLQEAGGLTDSFIFLPLNTLQRATGAEGRLSAISLKLSDSTRAREVAKALSARLKVSAQTQGDLLKFIEQALRISDAVRFGISLIALIVGGLAVANTVMMGVFERTREFGTLRAIGAKPNFVRSLVLTESLLLAVVGGVGGVLLGLVGIWGVNLYTQQLAAIDAAALTPRLVALSVLVSLILGLVAGLLPARSAGRIPITEALGRV